jgi:hypothetical protein
VKIYVQAVEPLKDMVKLRKSSKVFDDFLYCEFGYAPYAKFKSTIVKNKKCLLQSSKRK